MGNKIQIPDDVYKSLGMEKPKIETVDEKPSYQRGSDAHYLREADKDFPKFVRVHGSDLRGELCACTGVKEVRYEENKYYTRHADAASFRVLEGPHAREERSIELRELTIDELLDADDKLNNLYKDTMDSIHCKIHTYLYPEIDVPADMDRFDLYCKRIEPIAKHDYEPEGVHTFEEGYEWLLKNHPQEYMQASMQTNIGGFSCGAIPQAYDEYLKPGDKLRWPTKEGREAIVREFAKTRGYEVGTFDYTEMDAIVARDHDKIAASLANQGLSLKEPVPERVPSKAEQEIMAKWGGGDNSDSLLDTSYDFDF